MGFGAADTVGRISSVQNGSKGSPNQHFAYGSGGFAVNTVADAPGVKSVDVPGVVLRAKTNYRTFDIARTDLPIWVEDIIKTAPDSSLAIDLFIGGRVGVKQGSAVKLINEGEARVLDEGQWRKIAVSSGGAWAKFQKRDQPLTIQTRGGVLGIKG